MDIIKLAGIMAVKLAAKMADRKAIQKMANSIKLMPASTQMMLKGVDKMIGKPMEGKMTPLHLQWASSSWLAEWQSSWQQKWQV